MRRIIATSLILLACFIQLSLTASSQISIPTVNLVLIGIVLCGCFFDGTEDIWLALIAGLILDMFSISQFGINTAFLLVIAFTNRLLIKLNKSNTRLSYSIIIIGLGTIFYNILLMANLLFSDSLISYGWLTRQVGLEVLYNILVFLVLYFCIILITRHRRRPGSKLSFGSRKKRYV